MKLTLLLLFVGSWAALAATEEQISPNFNVPPGGKLVVDVDFGSVTVTTNSVSGVTADVWRKVDRNNKAEEQKFLREYPVHFARDGSTVTVRAWHPGNNGRSWWWPWSRRYHNSAKYTICVPTTFNVQLKTAGGGISVSDIIGNTASYTSGGGLHFARLHGPLDGNTSGGGIQLSDCNGALKIHTSGGGITVTGGSGALDGHTSGGPVTVKNFKGDIHVGTSGGGITVENVIGEVEGFTSGGGISAELPSPLLHVVDLSTSGGGVTVRVPANAAFDLDAATSGGGVSSELPVTVTGQIKYGHLKGPVNGGGKTVRLRSSGGSIQVKRP